MNRRMLAAFFVAAPFVSVGSQPLRAQQEQIGIAVGNTPAGVQIEDLDGAPVDLGDYIGVRPAVVEFWAMWCSSCAALQPHMDTAHAKYGEEVEFLIVAVAVNQNQRRIRRHLESHPVVGRMLWDTDGRAVRAFMAPATSYVAVLDEDGVVVYTGLGGNQDIEAAVATALGR